MAKRYYIRTSAGRGDLLSVFNHAFLTRPTFKDRFVLSKKAQVRSIMTWEGHTVSGADITARLIAGGLREAVASSRHGGGSQIGTVIALAIEPTDSGSTGQLWLADYPTFMGMNQMGDILKAYAKLIEEQLQVGGAKVSLDRG